jgi:predicted helicase
MALHIGYESVEPWPLVRLHVADNKARAAGVSPRVILKPDREAGVITQDSETQLTGVPKSAWDYRLGNRSGLDWILDQHKEKTPKNPTIREKFNTYRFADHKGKSGRSADAREPRFGRDRGHHRRHARAGAMTDEAFPAR